MLLFSGPSFGILLQLFDLVIYTKKINFCFTLQNYFLSIHVRLIDGYFLEISYSWNQLTKFK